MTYWLTIDGRGSLGLSTRTISYEHCPASLSHQEVEEALGAGLDWIVVTESDEAPAYDGFGVEASSGLLSLSDFGVTAPDPAPESEPEPVEPDPVGPGEFPCDAADCDKSYPSQEALDFHAEQEHAPAPDEPVAKDKAPATDGG